MNAIVRWLILLFACPAVWAQGNAWTRNGLDGLSISALAVDPHIPGTMYAGTNATPYGLTPPWAGLRIFKTTDGGAHWEGVSNGLPPAPAPGDQYKRVAHVRALVVDPSNPSTVYASISSLYFAPGYVRDAPSVFKSADGGANWSASDYGLPATIWDFDLAIDSSNPNTLYAASSGSNIEGVSFQVFKSTDGGASWIRAGDSPRISPDYGVPYNYHASLAIDPHNPGRVYVGLYNAGIFKSTDAGATWSEAITGPLVSSPNSFLNMEHPLSGVSVIAIDPQNSGIIYAGTANFCGCSDEPIGTGLWKSSDGGANWTVANSFFPPGRSYGITSLAIHPQSAGTLYISSWAGVFKSTDGGEDWNPFNEGLQGSNSSLVLSSSGVLYAGTPFGIFKVTDWIPVLSLHSEFCETSPWTVAVSNGAPNTTIRLAGISNGQPWEVEAWGATDGNGRYMESGAFTPQVLGSHTLTVDVGGAHSNSVSFVVSDCELPGGGTNETLE